MDDIDTLALNDIALPTMESMSQGYSTPMTPMTPIHLDYPSMTPTATAMELPAPKRQRACSDVGGQSTCSFDGYDEMDFQQVWDSLDHSLDLNSIPAYEETENALDQKPKRKRKQPQTRSPSSRRKQVSANATPNASPKKSMIQNKTRTPPSTPKASIVSKNVPRSSSNCGTEATQPEFPGRCSSEQRNEKVARYLEKRSRRVWRKEIKYSCRKQFAESRPRVAGRFIPKPSTNSPIASKPTVTSKTQRRDVISPMSASSVDSVTSSSKTN